MVNLQFLPWLLEIPPPSPPLPPPLQSWCTAAMALDALALSSLSGTYWMKLLHRIPLMSFLLFSNSASPDTWWCRQPHSTNFFTKMWHLHCNQVSYQSQWAALRVLYTRALTTGAWLPFLGIWASSVASLPAMSTDFVSPSSTLRKSFMKMNSEMPWILNQSWMIIELWRSSL